MVYFLDNISKERKLQLSHDGTILYGVEQQCDGGDILKQFDLANNGRVKVTQTLRGLHVMWLELQSNDRFGLNHYVR